MEHEGNRKLGGLKPGGGIKEKMQRPGDLEKGEGGKMSGKPKEKANWKRSDQETPRQA